jgi:hypothetical protein
MTRTITVSNAWVSQGNCYPAEVEGKYMAIHFNSLQGYIEHIKDKTNFTANNRSSQKKEKGDWVDTKSFEQAVDFCENGSEEHTKAFKKAAKDYGIEAITSNEFLQVDEYDLLGEIPDMDLYFSGEQDYMVTHSSEETVPVIRIAVGISMAARITTKTMLNRGVALLGLIDQLETTGAASVELVIFAATACHAGLFCSSYPLKSAGEPLHISDLAFFLCSSSALRRLDFKVTETLPFQKFYSVTDEGYGQVASVNILKEYDDFLDGFDIVLSSNCNMTADHAREYIMEEARSSVNIANIIGEKI